MRIDKYLKVTRIIKRRLIAKELAQANRLFLNGKLAKAASEIKVGDEITIIFGVKEVKIRVLAIKEFCKKEEAFGLYELISERKISEGDIIES